MEAFIAWVVANPEVSLAIATSAVALFVAISKVTKNTTDDKVAGVLSKLLSSFKKPTGKK